MNAYGSHRFVGRFICYSMIASLVFGSLSLTPQAQGFELVLRWTIPIPVYPTRAIEPPARPDVNADAPFVILQRDSNQRSITPVFPITDTPIAQLPGDSAIRQSLRSGTFYTAHCECLVQTRSRTDRYERVGESFARGLSAEMATRLTQESCFNYARSHNQRSTPSEKIERYTMGRCEQQEEQLPDELRTQLTRALENLESQQQAQAQFERSAIPRLILRVALSGLAGGFMWRSRGGGIQLGSTQLARLTFVGLGYTLVGLLNGVIEQDPQLAHDGAMAGLLMLPGAFLGYGGDFDLTTGNQQSETINLTVNGMARVALPTVYLASRGYEPAPLLAGGALMGGCYNSAANLFERMRNHSRFFDGHTAVAEACTGAAFATGLALSLAAHHRQTIHLSSLPQELESVLLQYKMAGNQPSPIYQVIATNVGNQGPGGAGERRVPTHPQIASVCREYKNDTEAFRVGGAANRQLSSLAQSDPAVRQILCAPVRSLDRFRDDDKEFSCFDFENVVANHGARICGR